MDYIVKKRERKKKVDGICLGLLSLSAVKLLCSALWLRELNNSNKCDQSCCCTRQGSGPSETRIVFCTRYFELADNIRNNEKNTTSLSQQRTATTS